MMASSQHADDLATCPECGRSAMSEETPCSRCQEPEEEDEDYGDDQCQNCGRHVSETFRRVLGDNENIAHACQACTPRTEHYHGRVADTEADRTPVVQR